MCVGNLKLVLFVTLCKVLQVHHVELDLIDCGIDHEIDVSEGDVEISKYPWLGVLYYSYYGDRTEARAVTTVALIQSEFVIAPAADIGPMPKNDFRTNAIVLLGVGWNRIGQGVRNYVLHPEYGETYNTIALVQLRMPVRSESIRPLCPPPDRLRSPDMFVVKFKEGDDYNDLQKQVVSVTHVMSSLCKEFYLRANLYAKKMRPPHVSCAVSLEHSDVCVWDAGGALVARDVWGRWQLLGMGVRGPGCGAPSRYLDMMSYYPWIENSLEKFRRLSISKISKQKFILRAGSHAYQKFGNCDEGEKINLIYREMIVLRTDNSQYQFLRYNMSLYENVEYSCLTMELVNASAVSEMRVKHLCPRVRNKKPCHAYKGSVFEISVHLMFSDTCRFEMFAWGFKKDMQLIDIQEWKWEEGTFYEDFNMQLVEYRGTTADTQFGFEPIEADMWVPDYDLWSTTEIIRPSNITTREPPEGSEKDKGKGSDVEKFDMSKYKAKEPNTGVFDIMTAKPNPKGRYKSKPKVNETNKKFKGRRDLTHGYYY